jgi:16S rRNA (cytosine967-C5)-methyltransferase
VTPGARLAAAITVLDRWLAGQPAEQALTNWGRASRYAGSGDRLAVRDLVFRAIRCRRSLAALGGGETGRGLILGQLREDGLDPATLFTGEGHAPAPVTAAETTVTTPEGLVALDCPDWLAPSLQRALAGDFPAVMQALRARAPVHLRANLARESRAEVLSRLAQEGIAAVAHPLAPTAIEVTGNARKIAQTPAYLQGFVELQDAASQAVVAELPLRAGQRVLDYCAGGGGKTLAIAAVTGGKVWAHDADPARMRDLPARAARAGARVALLAPGEVETAAPFDLILADVPCSGSGSWRRSPEGKWALTPARLTDLHAVQDRILARIADLVAPGGQIAYATCSMLAEENEDRVAAFVAAHPGWTCRHQRRFSPLEGGDGFFVALLSRE